MALDLALSLLTFVTIAVQDVLIRNLKPYEEIPVEKRKSMEELYAEAKNYFDTLYLNLNSKKLIKNEEYNFFDDFTSSKTSPNVFKNLFLIINGKKVSVPDPLPLFYKTLSTFNTPIEKVLNNEFLKNLKNTQEYRKLENMFKGETSPKPLLFLTDAPKLRVEYDDKENIKPTFFTSSKKPPTSWPRVLTLTEKELLMRNIGLKPR